MRTVVHSLSALHPTPSPLHSTSGPHSHLPSHFLLSPPTPTPHSPSPPIPGCRAGVLHFVHWLLLWQLNLSARPLLHVACGVPGGHVLGTHRQPPLDAVQVCACVRVHARCTYGMYVLYVRAARAVCTLHSVYMYTCMCVCVCVCTRVSECKVHTSISFSRCVHCFQQYLVVFRECSTTPFMF